MKLCLSIVALICIVSVGAVFARANDVQQPRRIIVKLRGSLAADLEGSLPISMSIASSSSMSLCGSGNASRQSGVLFP